MNRLLTLTCIFVFSVSSTFGSVITQTLSVSPSTTDYVEGPASTVTFDDFLNAPGYSAGDILNSVTLSATVNQAVMSLSVQNFSPSTETFNFITTGTYDVGGTAPDQGALEAAIRALGVTNLFVSGYQPLASGATYTAPAIAGSSGIGSAVSTTTGTITAASIAPYNTSGTFTLNFDTATTETDMGGGGNQVFAQTSQAGATFTVVYSYTLAAASIPEPATITLLGGALFGIAFLGRRRIATLRHL